MQLLLIFILFRSSACDVPLSIAFMMVNFFSSDILDPGLIRWRLLRENKKKNSTRKRDAMMKLQKIMKDVKGNLFKIKKRIVEAFPVVTYGCRNRLSEKKKQQDFKMWTRRRLLRVYGQKKE
ncbi:hypothetical protein LAZ67_12002758 [Cordylochernes scorpioides]|uniref:Uncharacterized protein n=1 Tax=Cordylochernes scorpioides TaxID=51811 RepID=A0ABY6L215_9ARAC|nr:hypothetical protein LAZ67_12002758 [Cordylochernes scorpioides]